jgi:phosphohistidine phosphatase
MELYLVRHAVAEETSSTGRDADRALTREGETKMRRTAQGLRALGVRFDLILTSPHRRASQTADVLAAVLGGVGPRVVEELAAGAEVGALLAAVRSHRQVEALALVGHQPDLGHLASQIMTGSPDLCPLPFKKGGTACFTIPNPRANLRGELEWFMTPKQLRALGQA